MTKDILSQYADLKEEIKDLRERIEKLKKSIEKIEADGNVIDKVRGGDGGLQSFKIEGFPYPEYGRKKTMLYMRMANLEVLECDLLELVNKVDDYINSVTKPKIRMMLRYRFLDDMTWMQVARRMGEGYTADACRMAVERYLSEAS